MWWILKVLGFYIAILGLSLIFSLFISIWITKALPRDSATGKLNIKINPWLLALMTLGVSLSMTQYLDHRPIMSLGFHFYSSWWIELALGVIIGCIMLIAMVLMMWVFTKKSPFEELSFAKLATLPGHLRGAIGEELAVRGYPFQVFVGATGIYPAVLVTSAFFGLLHYQTQRLIGAIDTALAGLLLATAVLKTEALWLAAGIHFGWNFAEEIFNLGEVDSQERYLAEMFAIIVFWLLLIALPIQPHPEMQQLWSEYITRTKP
jgi:membrane protease YdiL (CAAX protease family)